MKITQAILDELTAKAKASPRLRMNYVLRDSAEDTSQRMLNAIEPGAPLPIHRHQNSSETVVCLRGRLVEEYACSMIWNRSCMNRGLLRRTAYFTIIRRRIGLYFRMRYSGR